MVAAASCSPSSVCATSSPPIELPQNLNHEQLIDFQSSESPELIREIGPSPNWDLFGSLATVVSTLQLGGAGLPWKQQLLPELWTWWLWSLSNMPCRYWWWFLIKIQLHPFRLSKLQLQIKMINRLVLQFDAGRSPVTPVVRSITLRSGMSKLIA